MGGDHSKEEKSDASHVHSTDSDDETEHKDGAHGNDSSDDSHDHGYMADDKEEKCTHQKVTYLGLEMGESGVMDVTVDRYNNKTLKDLLKHFLNDLIADSTENIKICVVKHKGKKRLDLGDRKGSGEIARTFYEKYQEGYELLLNVLLANREKEVQLDLNGMVFDILIYLF